MLIGSNSTHVLGVRTIQDSEEAAKERRQRMGSWSIEVGGTLVASGCAPWGVDFSGYTGSASVYEVVEAKRTRRKRVEKLFKQYTLSGKIKDAERATEDELLELALAPRPKTRADCLPGGINEQRPCPFVSCRHHMAIVVNPLYPGAVQMRFGDADFEDMPHTCALDAAEDGPHTLRDIGVFMNRTKERIRQEASSAIDAFYSLSPSMLRLENL